MKKKNLLMYALASLVLAGCSEDLPDGGDGGNGTPSAGGDAWVSLNIQTAGATKALHDPEQENGTANETKVSKIMALFFDAHLTDVPNNPNLLSTVSWDAGDPEISNPGQPIGTPTKAFKVKKGSKAFLIVLNPSPDFEAKVSTAGTFNDVNQAIINTNVSSVIGSNKDYFMMTNAKGKLEPTTIATSGSSTTVVDDDLVTYANPTDAELNSYVVKVDRVAAKVRLFADTKYDKGSSLDINTIGWTLNVTNKKYYPMSERDLTWLESTPRGCITPFDIWKFGSYRIDPNYNNQKKTMADITSPLYKENYDYYTHATAPSWQVATADSTGTNAEKIPALYCLENTQEEDDNYQAYTTHVLLKVESQPKGLKLPGGVIYDGDANNDADVDEEGTVNSGSDWIKIGTNGYYSYNLVVKYIEAELTSKYRDKDPDNFLQTSVTNQFGAYLDALVAQSVLNVKAVELPTKDEFDEKLAAASNDSVKVIRDIAAEFYQGGVITHGADAHGNVSYYKGGQGYHVIMIKHDNDSDNTNNKYGEFGVVRNSVYDIAIKDIKSPGYPIIPDPDPEKPDEEDESYISVQIDINPWTWYRQEVEL